MLRTNKALAITAGTLLALSLSQEIQQLPLPHDIRTFISFQGSMPRCIVSAVQQCKHTLASSMAAIMLIAVHQQLLHLWLVLSH